jgi:hypothetical protein
MHHGVIGLAIMVHRVDIPSMFLSASYHLVRVISSVGNEAKVKLSYSSKNHGHKKATEDERCTVHFIAMPLDFHLYCAACYDVTICMRKHKVR